MHSRVACAGMEGSVCKPGPWLDKAGSIGRVEGTGDNMKLMK